MPKNLSKDFLASVGLSLSYSDSEYKLSRNKSGKAIDYIATIIGLFSIPMLAYVIGMLLHRMTNNELEIQGTIFLVAVGSIGITFLVLFVRAWDRLLQFVGFSLKKKWLRIRDKAIKQFCD